MKKSGLCITAAVLCGVLSAGVCSNAFAAEENIASFALDQMIVTAQRSETKDLDTPASVTVITAKDIENSGVQTAYEIIEHQVGFTNNAYGPYGLEFGGSCSRTVLRGLDKGTLVMVNGAPINMLNYNNMTGIPVDSIEKIEIVRGAQSVLHGPEAFGGVVNIITKKGGGEKTKVSVKGGNYLKNYSINHAGENYTLAFSRDYFGDVDQANRIFNDTTKVWQLKDSTLNNFFTSFAPSEKVNIYYAHTDGDIKRDRMNRKGGEYNGTGTSYSYKDKRDNVSVRFNDEENQLSSVISYNYRKVDPKQGSIKNFEVGEMKASKYSNWKLQTMTFDLQKGWDLRDAADHLILGTTLSKEMVDDKSAYIGNIDGKYVYEPKSADRENAAIYASYKYAASDDLTFNVGMRGEHIDDVAEDQNVFLPEVSALYKISDTASWYVEAGRSFQMPALNQYFKPGRTDKLKPQKGWTYETGVKFIDDDKSLKVDLFHMDIDGKFDWYKVDGYDQKILMNSGKFKNTGLEAEFTHNVNDDFAYHLGGMYGDPKTKERGMDDYVQSDAKLQLTAGIDYRMGKLLTNLNYLYLGKRQMSYYTNNGSKAKAATADHRVPFRSVLNACFTYRPDTVNSLKLNLNNILDRNDTINKYENWGLPFNWTLEYEYTF